MSADAQSHPVQDRPARGSPPLRPPGTEHPRRRRQLDWELITCGVRGHALAGDGVKLDAEREALVSCEAGHVRWHRCLRCDTWLSLPADERIPPRATDEQGEVILPLRGKALHDRIILRLIALDRVFHFIVLGLLGVAVLLFTADRVRLQGAFYRVLAALQGGVAGGPVQTTGHVGIVHDFDRLFTLRAGTLHEVGIAVLAYALLEGVEAVGLWYGKRWAEYLTFLATTVLLPLEVYEIIHRGTVLKVIGFVINLAVVFWLLLRKRLFGLRGGAAADEAERMADAGWEAVALATPAVPCAATQPAPGT